MAYTPTEWKDHIVEHPNRYRVVDNGDGTVDILDEHGAVIQQGTPVDATRLNKIEQGIKEAHDAIASHLNDNVRHVTQSERNSWNNKVSKTGDTMTGDLRIESVSPQLVFTYTEGWDNGIRGRIVAKNNVKEVWSIGDSSSTGDLYIKNLVNSPIHLISGYLVVTNSVTNNFFFLMVGNGSPEGNVSAPYGSLYVRTDAGAGARLWVKDTPGGNTGWKAVQTA